MIEHPVAPVEPHEDLPACPGCRFFEPVFTHGLCRRYAPRPSVDGSEPAWPEVAGDDWCGEFEKVADAPG